MGVKVTGLDELIRDLEAIPEKGGKKFGAVVGKGATNVKRDWQRRWSPRIGGGPENLPHVVRGIGYDRVPDRGTHFEAEIGVSRRNPQASLAHFAEMGSVRNAPIPGGLPALLTEDPKFVQAVADAAVELLEGL